MIEKGEWDPILPDGVRIQGIIHNRLKHIKEIIERDPQGIEGRSERPGGIPRPEDQKESYMTIYIITNNSEKNSTIMWAEEASN